jgi:type I restriction enzyme S subunit
MIETSGDSPILRQIKTDAVGNIPSHWKIRSVAELIRAEALEKIQDGNHGESHPVASDYVATGIPFLMSGNIRNGRVDMAQCKFLAPEHAKSLRVGHAHRDDVLLTHKGNDLGRTAIMTEVDWAVLTPQITYYRIKNSHALLPDFLKCVFESPTFQHQFKRDSEQSTRPFVSISNQQSLYLPIPPLEEQRAIAHTLGSLEDKIELNRQMNETLEAMARAIFKSWFVDFDPVRAKAEGRDPGLPNHIADLFPDRFEDCELGEIPAGWKVGKVDEVATLSRDSINPGDFPDETFEHFSIPAFDEGKTPKREYGGAIKSNKFLIPSDAILLSKLNPRIPRLWLPIVKNSPSAICSTEFLVVVLRINIYREFIYGFLSSKTFADVFETLVTGTSGSHQRVKPEGLLSMNIIIPGKSVAQEFSKMVQPLLARIHHGRDESQTLAVFRDTLLPKLISGELRINTVKSTIKFSEASRSA